MRRPRSSVPRASWVKRESVLLSVGSDQLSLTVSAWEVLCITLKLAKVFPHDRCLALQTSGGRLDLFELTKVRFHIEVILLKSMEPTDFLMPDLTLADQDPSEAFLEGDPRREQFLDYSTLTRIIALIKDAQSPLNARRVSWRREVGTR